MEREDTSRLTRGEGRRFALAVGLAFLALGGLSHWRGHGLVSLVLATGGSLLVALGLIVPSRLGPIYRAWMGLAGAVSRVTNPVVLTLLYLLVITPAGLLGRLLGRDPLRQKGTNESRWTERGEDSLSDMRRQF